MSQRHPIQGGHTMFVTTNCLHRQAIFFDPACARAAVETLYTVQELRPFFLYGFVVMPDHVHLLLRAPEGGSISKIIGLYKRAVAFNVGRGPMWQPRFHMLIPDRPAKVLRYIAMNPVRKGLCGHPEEYPWSSFSGRWPIIEYSESF